MSTSSPPAVSDDPPADIETGLREPEKEVDARKAMIVNRVMEAYFLIYVVFFTGMVVYLAKVSKNWWRMGLSFLALLSIMIITFWMISQTRKLLVNFFATKRSIGTDSDVSTKLLASEK
ncbi:hypothetical protein EJB05_25944 [Eragrostis curvula]|uniref:Uncharacterized protein n=1 Tax=Eragrostis curvula TaxID=38414 RepID=A0A5J9UK56_9POAL|nr:hypothetical protein EJB05_25944 [Eragrostis curvula]